MQKQEAMMMGIILFITLVIWWVVENKMPHYREEQELQGYEQDKWATPAFLFVVFIAISGISLYPLTSNQETPVGLPINAAIIAVPLGLILPIAMMRLIRNLSKKSHFLRIVFLLSASLAGIYGASGLILCLNGALDRSAGVSYITIVVNKIINKSKITSYEVHLKDWTNSGKAVVVKVDPHIYQSVVEGKPVKVLVHKGFLGMEWIAKIEVVKAI